MEVVEKFLQDDDQSICYVPWDLRKSVLSLLEKKGKDVRVFEYVENMYRVYQVGNKNVYFVDSQICIPSLFFKEFVPLIMQSDKDKLIWCFDIKTGKSCLDFMTKTYENGIKTY